MLVATTACLIFLVRVLVSNAENDTFTKPHYRPFRSSGSNHAPYVDYETDESDSDSFPGEPMSCEGSCPSYELVEQRPDYEVRDYAPAYWLSAVIFAENRVLAELEGYEKLLGYMKGQNDRDLKFNMTIPLITQIKYRDQPGVGPQTKDYTVSLYLPFPWKPTVPADPPDSLNSEVLVDSAQRRIVFVQRFQAHLWQVSDKQVRIKTAQMMTLLGNAGEAFLDKFIYLAAYGRPKLDEETIYELWIFASRFRDPNQLRPRIKSLDPPVSKVTMKTKKRLCRGLECPNFDVLRVYKYGIQKRRYFDSKFASFSLEGCYFTQMGIWQGFMPLHLYRHGVNSHLEILEATRPIGIVHIKGPEPRDGGGTNHSCDHNFTVSSYLPERLHANPPTTGPQGPRIRITTMDDLIVFVFPVGGYILVPERMTHEVERFQRRLTQFGVCFRPHEYYVAVYDFVIRFYGRLNEIWLVAELCEATDPVATQEGEPYESSILS